MIRDYLNSLIKTSQMSQYQWQLDNLEEIKIYPSLEVIGKDLSYLDLNVKECFRNAILIANAVEGVKYCEGYIFFHIPIHHAWNSYHGKDFDLTSEMFFQGNMGTHYSKFLELSADQSFSYNGKFRRYFTPGEAYWYDKVGKKTMIKAKEVTESILSIFRIDERNIYNVKDVEDWIEWILSRQHLGPVDMKIKKWFRSTVRNYMINEFPHTYTVIDANISREDKDKQWIVQAIKSRDLYNVEVDTRYGDYLIEKLNHVIDYFSYIIEHSDEIPKSLWIRNLDRISVKDAIQKSEEWTKWLAERDSAGWEEGEEIVKRTSDGFVVKRLISVAALNREGKEMQHCVGSYADAVEDEHVTIYSLRDGSNNPHVTIEVDKEDNVQQIKGKQNNAPIEKYHGAVIEFLNWLNPDGALELENIDAVDYDGRFYHISEVPPSYWTRDDEGIDRLMNLVTSNKLGPLEGLLKAGVSPDIKNRYGHTMLYYACDRNRLNLVKMLLSYDADPNVGDAPILKAAFLGERDIVNLLLDKGADVTIDSSNDSEHLIHHCVKQGWYDEVVYILKHGERVDVRNYYDNTPLIIAAGKNDLRMVKLLLSYGADPTKRGNLNRLAVHGTNDLEIKKLIK
jgi:hypothetical protein